MTWRRRKPKIALLVAEQTNSGQNFPASREAEDKRGDRKGVVAGAVLGVLVFAVAGIAYHKFYGTPKHFSIREMRAEQLTQSGKVGPVAISADGQEVAYVLRDGAQQSVMLRKVQTGDETQIVGPGMVMVSGLTFSPDGNFLYYTASSKENMLYSWLYKVPVQGGPATALVEDIDTAISFSPDGERFAFVRGIPDRGENHLVVANVDGSGAKAIARRNGQVYAQSLIAPTWSPDGKTILFTNYQAGMKRFLVAVAPDGSGLRELYSTREELGRARWLPDGGSAIVPMREGSLADRGQLWSVSFPAGTSEKLTDDVKDYSLQWIDTDREAKSLVTVQTTITGDLWILPEGDSARGKQASTGTSPVAYVAVFGKEKILYETRDGNVYVANADGGNARALPIGGRALREVSACGNGKHVVYSQVLGEATDIWRIDADGSNAVQLTHENSASMPNCSMDGHWLFYWNEAEHGMYRTGINGGERTKVNFVDASYPFCRISPDGKSVVYDSVGPQHPQKGYKILIAPVTGGKVTANFPMVEGMGMTTPQWAMEGHGFYFNLTRQGAANIWKMDSPGGPVKQVTNFSSGLIASYAWSQDGKTLYVARGTKSSDAFLLKATK